MKRDSQRGWETNTQVWGNQRKWKPSRYCWYSTLVSLDPCPSLHVLSIALVTFLQRTSLDQHQPTITDIQMCLGVGQWLLSYCKGENESPVPLSSWEDLHYRVPLQDQAKIYSLWDCYLYHTSVFHVSLLSCFSYSLTGFQEAFPNHLFINPHCRVCFEEACGPWPETSPGTQVSFEP